MKVIEAGIGVGAATLMMVPTIYLLQKAGLLTPKSILDLLIGIAAIILIATAVMIASWILSVGNYKKYPSLEWSASVGLSMIAFTIPTLALGTLIVASSGLGFILLAAGMLGVFLIAVTMIGVAEILNQFDWDKAKAPSLAWSGGVALALMAFGTAILLSAPLALLNGVMSLFGGGVADGLFLIVDAIVEIGKKFNDSSEIDWDTAKHPTSEWAAGVGGAIMAFSSAIADIDDVDLDVDEFITTSKGLVTAIVAIGGMFNLASGSFNDNNIPSKKWAAGVGGSLAAFSSALHELHESGLDIDAGDANDGDSATRSMVLLAQGLINVGKLFRDNPHVFLDSTIPSTDWGDKVGNALIQFAKSAKELDGETDFAPILSIARAIRDVSMIFKDLEKFDITLTDTVTKSMAIIIEAIPAQEVIDPLWSLIDALEHLSNISWKDMLDMKLIAKVISSLAEEVNNINEEKVISLNKLGAGLHMISLIDDTKLRSVLDTIEAKSNTIKEIMDDGGFIRNIFENMFSKEEKITENDVIEKSDDKSDIYQEKLLTYIKNIDKNIKTISDTNIMNSKDEQLDEPQNVKEINDSFKNDGKSSGGASSSWW